MAQSLKQNIKQFFNWEYWPAFMFYIPLLPNYIYLAIKSKSLMYFTATNPSIKGGGCGIESKNDVFKLIPSKYKPKTAFIPKNTPFDDVLNILKDKNLDFPLIVKPNIGSRGLLVNKVDSQKLLKQYINMAKIDIIIQEFILAKKEYGLMYYRYPNSKVGTISSLISKEFMFVIGDGTSNLTELIQRDTHLHSYLPIIKNNFEPTFFLKTPNKEQVIMLSHIGNHSKGAKFFNENHLINELLINTMNKISLEIDGWHYGRMDIKCNSYDELVNGDFKIIDLNGVTGEPAHIYDSEKSSYKKALKVLKEHWLVIQEIAIESHKMGNKFSSSWNTLKSIFSFMRHTFRLKRLTRKGILR